MNFNFEYLKHGKALCGKVFSGFVETFNLHNDFIRNLTGDADIPKGGGHINFDKADPFHPVIRCDGKCGGSGGVTANEKSGLTVENGMIDIADREEHDAFGIHEFTVITGGEFRISGNDLQVKWTKVKIKSVTVEPQDTPATWKTVMSLDEVTVPTELSYSEDSAQFTQKPLTMLVPSAGDAGEEEVVFETTPHSDEHSGE